MPLHFPHLGHHHHDDNKKKSSSSRKEKEEPPAFITLAEDGRRQSIAPSVSSSNTPSGTSPSTPGNGSDPSSPSMTPRRTSFQTARPSTVGTSGHPPQQRTFSSSSGVSQQSSQLHGILRNTPMTSPSVSGSEYTSFTGNSSSTPFANMHKRMSSLAFDRTDTIESTRSASSFVTDDHYHSDPDHDHDHDHSGPSTPATSISSFNNTHCPLPASNASQRFPFFMMTISSTSTLSFIALPLGMRPIVIDSINRAWKKGISKMSEVDYQSELMKRHKDKGCEGGVWEITLKGEAWMPTSSEQVSSKRIMINLLTDFAREGYSLTSSFRTSAKDSGKDTLTFLRDEPDPDPIFFAVAFYSHDRIWIIDAEADVGQAVEEGIKNWWMDGVRDARVRERHCRELRLKGAPWTAHSTTSLISARVIHLVIIKTITHTDTGYDFVGSIDMADKEEGEMPVTFYRRRWGRERAVWSLPEPERNGSPASANGNGNGNGNGLGYGSRESLYLTDTRLTAE
ncbi:hypothetical protein CI109_102560 [Kwoniella shandongensis]|uniref:Uncharacterized protein n=1 Tax=Kwoniella shandongensis TaxID=1734106 RepID=A0A5M6BUX8_9TREE|nr:uncharacterized protein CI109_005824 [Kwoniella shandongensis]KAA5525802.1 hypothetical protein CI109_005824 [Kwoniella shandongensis]